MMGIVVRVNRLRFKPSDGVKLLDGSCTQPSQSPEDSPLNLRNFCVLNRIHERVLCLGSMILQLFGCILFAKGRDLVEVHFQVMGHLLSKLILWCLACQCQCNDSRENDGSHGEQSS